MNKFIKSILISTLLIPSFVFSATAVGWSTNSPTTGWFSPNKINGVNQVINALAGLFTNASSTFSGSLYFPALTQGFLYTGSAGKVGTVSTSTIFGFTPANQATTITVNGTANQITSSAGAQDLSANRTWTLSFPNQVIFPQYASTTNGFSTPYASSTIGNIGTLTVGTLSGILKGTSGLVSTASNGTDYTLITANTCGAGQHFSQVTASGIFTCTADTGGSGLTWPWTLTTNFGQTVNSTTTALWLRGSPYSGMASSTFLFENASTSLLSIDNWIVSTSTTVCAYKCQFSSIQTALNAGYKNIQLKAETYTGPVSIIASDTTIKGAGMNASLISCSTNVLCVSIATSSALTRITLEDFGIVKSGAEGGVGLDTSDTSNVYTNRMNITNFTLAHLHKDFTNQSFYSSFNNMRYSGANCFATAGTLANDNATHNARCIVTSSTGVGYDFVNTEGWLLDNVNAEPGSIIGTGLRVDGTSIGITVINPWFEVNATGTEIMAGALNTKIIGGRITGGTRGLWNRGTGTVIDNTLITANTTNIDDTTTLGIYTNTNSSLYTSAWQGIGTSTPGDADERLALRISTSNSGANMLVLNNAGNFATSPAGIEFTNSTGGFASGTARIYANPGSGFTNSKFTIGVADSSKVLQDRLTIDVNGYVGISSTTPTSFLSVGRDNLGTFSISTSTDGCPQFTKGLMWIGTCAGGGSVTSVVAGAGFLNQGLNITGSGTLTVGIATSSNPTIGQVPYWTSVGDTSNPAKLSSVATSSIANGTGITVTNGSSAYVIGSQPTINCNTANASTFGCLAAADFSKFNSATTTAGTGLTYSGNAFNVNTSQNIATLSNLTSNGAILTSGGVGTLGIYTGTSCTNQFVRSLNGSISATCATVANTDLANSSITINGSSVSLGGSITVASTTLLSDLNNWTKRQEFANTTTTLASFNYASTTSLFANLFTLATTTAGTLKTNSSGLVWVDTSGGGAGYSTIQDEGSGLTARSILNFTGSGVNCVDNSGSSRTDCTINAGAATAGGSDKQLQFNDAGSLAGGNDLIWDKTQEKMGVGTTTNLFSKLTIATTTVPQLSLTGGGGVPQWVFRSVGGGFYLASTTIDGLSTTTTPVISVSPSNKLGIGCDNTSPSRWAFGCGTNININPNINLLVQDPSDARMGVSTSDDFIGLKSVGGALGLFGFDYAGGSALNINMQEFGGKIGIATSSPWGTLSIFPFTYNANVPLFHIATSTQAGYGDSIFSVFATSTSKIVQAVTGRLSEIGTRVGVGVWNYLGFGGLLDQFVVRGRINTQDWLQNYCDSPVGGVAISANGIAGCGGFSFMKDSTGAATMTATAPTGGGNTFARLATTITNNGVGVFANGVTTGWLTLATSTPVMEVSARVINSNASTTQYFIGFTNLSTAGSTYETEPTRGCYLTASSTTANWRAICRTNSGSANMTMVDTGVASSTIIGSTGGFRKFRIEADTTTARFYIQANEASNLINVANITTTYPSTQLLNAGVHYGVVSGGITTNLDLFRLRFWWRDNLPQL